MFAVIRIRGHGGTIKDIENTLKMLRLNAINNCAIIPETPEFKGMIEKCIGSVTYGQIDKGTLVSMLEKRLRLMGDKRVDIETLKRITGYDSFEKFANMLLEGKTRLSNFKDLQPIFRLTPPSKGFSSLRETYPKGDLGFRGEKINELIIKMI